MKGLAAVLLTALVGFAPADGGQRLSPLVDAKWLESFDLPEGRMAFVSVPLGATEPRPVMVGMHGAGDRPEWACGGYRAATNAFPFIICPRGIADGPSAEKYHTPSPSRILQDVDATLAALRRRFGPYVADGPLLYAGFSLGASHGASVIAQRAAMFPVALLIEGAYPQITPALAREYARGGGRRVMLGCGQLGCKQQFSAAFAALRGAGIDVRILDAHTGRHNLDGAMMEALRDAWPWLVSDDPRWPAP
ncbi:MAG TPA: hypothetical protein VGL13_01300 [Polyangiaceae bacterium]